MEAETFGIGGGEESATGMTEKAESGSAVLLMRGLPRHANRCFIIATLDLNWLGLVREPPATEEQSAHRLVTAAFQTIVTVHREVRGALSAVCMRLL